MLIIFKFFNKKTFFFKFLDASTPRPLLSTETPICPPDQLACADRKCLNKELFCDGSIDCADASDESWCDPEHDPNSPDRCNLSNCTLPDCFCSSDGTRIPGDLKPEETPQMVILFFFFYSRFLFMDYFS